MRHPGPRHEQDDDEDDRWRALERRVAALEAAAGAERAGSAAELPSSPSPAAGSVPPARAGGGASFWALEEVRRQVAGHGLDGGAVLFTGTATLPGGTAEWQETRVVDDLLDDGSLDALEAPASALAALGSPVRLLLLVRVLRSPTGTASAAELTADEALGTSGQVYHHVRQLVAAGWLRTAARGRYAVPAERVVPLLVALALAGR
ncbi:ArsR family transcriptional regulator [Quadrisphaera setariae]|uniref:ArsR family transcriptional regulator n=1 Tax=Quadrisphaera setariae TaxID=2593304 RepID=A0A5C8ZLK7_9ACTN|nr:ArsR family transcriptional regulator [Quadrisphaera setariae]TXR58053.1 ArsR family transcriptional regulator [Quadrisphaera setariae]